jgi:hypothetical protein
VVLILQVQYAFYDDTNVRYIMMVHDELYDELQNAHISNVYGRYSA